MERKIQLIEHLKRLASYAKFKQILLGNDLSKKERFEIANFNVKYQILKLTDFNDEELIDETIEIGESILNLKN